MHNAVLTRAPNAALCYAYVGGPGEVVTAQDGKSVHPSCLHGTCCLPALSIDGTFLRACKQAALQFVVLKPILAVLTLLLEHYNLYGDGEFQANRGYAYLAFMYNICYTVALYGLLLFYVAAADLLAPHKPILKFVVVKSVRTMWRFPPLLLTADDIPGGVLHLLAVAGVLHDGEPGHPVRRRRGARAPELPHLRRKCAHSTRTIRACLTLSRRLSPVVMASFGMIFAFPYSDYNSGAADSFLAAVVHAASVNDVIADMVHQFAGKYGDYVLYSTDSQAAPKRHYIRERMDAAMLAAAVAAKQGVAAVKSGADAVADGRLGGIIRDGVVDAGLKVKVGVSAATHKVAGGLVEGVALLKEGRLGDAIRDGVSESVSDIAHSVTALGTKLDKLGARAAQTHTHSRLHSKLNFFD